MKTLLLVSLLVACGPSAAELKTAKTTTYKMSAHDMLALAEDVAQETYPIGSTNEGEHSFITAPKWYGPEGDLESPGAGGFVNLRDRSVEVAFIVQVVEFGGGDVAVTVTPKTFQKLSYSPKPRELSPDDPYLPSFVHGRADQLAMDIYNKAKPYAYTGH
jgi:hypothetical protein